MAKLVYISKDKRNAVIEECAKKLEELGYNRAAQHIRDIKGK